MARGLGDKGVVMVGAAAIAAVRNYTIDEDGPTVDLPAMGDTLKWKEPQIPDKGGSVECWADETDTAGQGAITIGALVDLEFRPLGDGSGLPEITAQNCRVTRVSRNVPTEGGREFTFDFTLTDTDFDDTAQP